MISHLPWDAWVAWCFRFSWSNEGALTIVDVFLHRWLHSIHDEFIFQGQNFGQWESAGEGSVIELPSCIWWGGKRAGDTLTATPAHRLQHRGNRGWNRGGNFGKIFAEVDQLSPKESRGEAKSGPCLLRSRAGPCLLRNRAGSHPYVCELAEAEEERPLSPPPVLEKECPGLRRSVP
ncbi:hypothetical protein DPEC_G00125480 [Dallia pectoralis]|uniref:Uncharacterized protein n=1 Tax=Dallia pectoralis TaxID=75939 RepID=A0ACC2GRJ0_DALPE|nr:hypothetical protein DPEC_G00125480 [Dallia pectoralis]